MLVVQIKQCKDKSYCLDKKAISKWLSGRFIVIRHNYIRFDETVLGPDSIVRESKYEFVPIMTRQKVEIPFKVVQTEVHLQDMPIRFDELTNLKDSNLFNFV
mmetsp:Transcript_26394/g.35270  ORF Transcript_26394/g.35270 Transcript_26394/m.35270 type:complete len:102 (+) Transcript_26394:533-838(+)